MSAYPLSALAAAAALVVYLVLGFHVGRLRARFKVAAPSMDGPEAFRRAVRVQANTLEQIVGFLPALALFAAFWGDRPAALIGVLWPIGRVLYARAYLADPATRGPGFLLALASTSVLLAGSIVGALRGAL
jgi:glutathione S-transferase